MHINYPVYGILSVLLARLSTEQTGCRVIEKPSQAPPPQRHGPALRRCPIPGSHDHFTLQESRNLTLQVASVEECHLVFFVPTCCRPQIPPRRVEKASHHETRRQKQHKISVAAQSHETSSLLPSTFKNLCTRMLLKIGLRGVGGSVCPLVLRCDILPRVLIRTAKLIDNDKQKA